MDGGDRRRGGFARHESEAPARLASPDEALRRNVNSKESPPPTNPFGPEESIELQLFRHLHAAAATLPHGFSTSQPIPSRFVIGVNRSFSLRHCTSVSRCCWIMSEGGTRGSGSAPGHEPRQAEQKDLRAGKWEIPLRDHSVRIRRGVSGRPHGQAGAGPGRRRRHGRLDEDLRDGLHLPGLNA